MAGPASRRALPSIRGRSSLPRRRRPTVREHSGQQPEAFDMGVLSVTERGVSGESMVPGEGIEPTKP